MGGGGFRLWRRQVNLEKFGTNKGFIFSILVLSTLFDRVWWPSCKSWNKMEVVVYKQIFLLYKFAFMNFFDGITPYASKTPLKVRSEKRARKEINAMEGLILKIHRIIIGLTGSGNV